MKKFVFFTAIAAALLAVSSCKEKPIDNPEVLPAPANASYAKKLILEDNDENIESIELTEGGRYIITLLVDNPSNSAPTKAGGKSVKHLIGTYTVEGNTFTLKGWGSITIDANILTIILENGKTFKVGFTVGAQAPGSNSNDFYTTIARSWKVDNSRVSVNADGQTVTVTKPGCDLPSVAAELANKGVKIDPSRAAGYVVKEVTFTKSKTFSVSFTGQPAFVGDFDLKADNTFTYNFDGVSGNDFFNASSNGSVNYVAEDQQLVLSVSAVIKNVDNTKTYSGSVTLYMSEAK